MNTIYLVIYIYAGTFAKGDSVSLLSIPMPSMQACQQQGEKTKKLVAGTAKNLEFICLEGGTR